VVGAPLELVEGGGQQRLGARA